MLRFKGRRRLDSVLCPAGRFALEFLERLRIVGLHADRIPIVVPSRCASRLVFGPPGCSQRGWGRHAEPAVGTVGVVLVAPVGDKYLGCERAVELLDGGQFVAHADP